MNKTPSLSQFLAARVAFRNFTLHRPGQMLEQERISVEEEHIREYLKQTEHIWAYGPWWDAPTSAKGAGRYCHRHF